MFTWKLKFHFDKSKGIPQLQALSHLEEDEEARNPPLFWAVDLGSWPTFLSRPDWGTFQGFWQALDDGRTPDLGLDDLENHFQRRLNRDEFSSPSFFSLSSAKPASFNVIWFFPTLFPYRRSLDKSLQERNSNLRHSKEGCSRWWDDLEIQASSNGFDGKKDPAT